MNTPDENPLEEWSKPTPVSLPKGVKRFAREERAKQRHARAVALRDNRDRKIIRFPGVKKK